MKKKLLIPALLLTSAASFGQIRFAPEIGVTMFNQKQKVTVSNKTVSESSNFLPGLHVGGMVDIPVGDHFSVQPGLFYQLSRTKGDDLVIGNAAKATATKTIHSLQLPVYAMYKSGESGSGRFFAGLGPYFEYALGGNVHSKTTILGTTTESDDNMKFGNDRDDNQKPFDIGGTVTAGYELPMGLYIRGNFNLGLANLYPDGDSDHSLKNMSFGLSVGYFLGGR